MLSQSSKRALPNKPNRLEKARLWEALDVCSLRRWLQSLKGHEVSLQPVRAPHNRVELLAIGRPCRLELTHKVAQRLLVCDGVHHCSHGCLGLCERSLGDLEEQGVLAGNSFEIG